MSTLHTLLCEQSLLRSAQSCLVVDAAGRAAVWTVMREAWENEGDMAESRRGLFALPYISGPSLTSVRPGLPRFPWVGFRVGFRVLGLA